MAAAAEVPDAAAPINLLFLFSAKTLPLSRPHGRLFFFLPMKKRIIGLSLALAAGSAGHAFAQGASDALRYSQLQFGGSARTLGIAGANVALGADFGSLSSNPAGLGLFQKSELHITPGLGLGQGEGRIDGNSAAAQSENKNSFHIGSAGLVLTGRKADSDQSSNWRGGSLAFGFTRVADFNSASLYSGNIGNNQSFLARLQPQTANRSQAGFSNLVRDLDGQADDNEYTSDLGLAYGAYLVDVVADRTPARADSAVVLRRQGSVLTQSEAIINSGSTTQFDIGFGASYRDRLYVGGAIGILGTHFTQRRTLTESDNDNTTHFVSLADNTTLRTTGAGVNLRLGVIYRVADMLRVGASIQSPTFMNLTDTYSESLTSTFSAQGTDRVPSDLPVGSTTVSFADNVYDYSLTTPFRANGGAALTIGKIGFLTGDIEYVGYNQARLSDASSDTNYQQYYSFGQENSDIRARYQSAINLRFGGELRYDVFRLRAGYARYGDPYRVDDGTSRVQNFYTAGAGLRQGSFFLDAAVVYQTFNQSYTPYTIGSNLEPLIKVNNNRYTTSITAGVTF